MAVEYLQAGRLYNFSGQPMEALGHTFSKKVPPPVQREPLAFQFVTVTSGPVTGRHRKVSGSICFELSFQVFIHINKNALRLHSSMLSSPSSLSFF